jgi:hypothetical protein
MKKFCLLELQYNANRVLLECETPTKSEAVEIFRRLRPDLLLNDDGYARTDEENFGVHDGHLSYCVAEHVAA